MASNLYETRIGFALVFWGISFGAIAKEPGCRFRWYASKFPSSELICEGFDSREECERAALDALRSEAVSVTVGGVR